MNLIQLSPEEISAAIAFAFHIWTRREHYQELRQRDPLACFLEVLLAELGERSVICWLRANHKHAQPLHDKDADFPPLSHLLQVRDIRQRHIRAAVHTLLLPSSSDPLEYLHNTPLHLQAEGIVGINILVAFWMQEPSPSQLSPPALQDAALIGWESDRNLRAAGYFDPTLTSPKLRLSDLRPMNELLGYLV